MNTTAINRNVAARRRRVRPFDRGRLPRDTTAPARRVPRPIRDDASHTPPHGDAVLRPRAR